VVVGGGATLDLGALAASLYRRGMPLVLVPTTLLAMVDATLGGKTAVDFAGADGRLQKNFAGTFYPAREIRLRFDFLRTLPLRERVSGAGEVYKTMWIRGGKWDAAPLVEFVDSGKVTSGLGRIIQDCLRVKARLVEKDPLDEKRVRELLNFGHTVGHALESATGLAHGECVLWGMVVESAFAGREKKMFATALATAVSTLGLEMPPELSTLSSAEWVTLFSADKKSKGAKMEMSILSAPGKVKKVRMSREALAAGIARLDLTRRLSESDRNKLI
jgi:3-dehydroquinate synthase